MVAKVYFCDMRSGLNENLHGKLVRLMDEAGLPKIIDRGDLTAVKTHFGEKGGHAFVRPTFLRSVVERLKELDAKPFITDSSTLYPGERKDAVSALRCGIENGLAYAVAGAPLIMCDGLRGLSSRRVPINGKILKDVDIGLEILEADALVIVSHFKGHELTGFGGALKNLGMGCCSREGKMEQHSSVAPQIAAEICTACGACIKACAHDAIVFEEGKARIIDDKCVGCSRCISACPEKAIRIQWNESAPMAMKKWPSTLPEPWTANRGKPCISISSCRFHRIATATAIPMPLLSRISASSPPPTRWLSTRPASTWSTRPRACREPL